MPTGETFKNSGWTRVEDGLPEDLVLVLAHGTFRGDLFVGYYDRRIPEWYGLGMCGDLKAVDVIMWHPLPEPPKEIK